MSKILSLLRGWTGDSLWLGWNIESRGIVLETFTVLRLIGSRFSMVVYLSRENLGLKDGGGIRYFKWDLEYLVWQMSLAAMVGKNSFLWLIYLI